MLVLAAQTLIVGLLVLGLYELKGRFGLSPIFVFVASIQFLQNLLATSTSTQIFGSLVASPGSAVLFSSTLFALLLIYVREDITTARRLIYAVLLANLILSLVALSSRWAASLGYLQVSESGAEWLATYNALGFAVGTILLILDTFALLVLYEVLRSRLPWLPVGVLLVLPLTIVLAADTVLFTAVMQGGFETSPLLLGSLVGKTFAGALYGGLLTAYLSLRRDSELDERRREIRDPFSIFTFGERYRALENEVESLARRQDLERQRAEVALRGAELGAWDYFIQTGETFLDDRWAEMLGYTRDEIDPVIESWEERIHLDDRERARETLRAHLEGETDLYQLEHRLRTRSGDWKWILTMGKVVERDDQGRPVRMTGTHLDIDERRRAERKEQRLGHILENSVNEIYTFDPETLRFVDANAGARTNLGYRLEELRDLTPVDIKPEYTRESFAELIAPLRQEGRGEIQFTTLHRRKDGTRYPVEVHLQKLLDGDPVFLAIVLDISRREEADRRRRKLERRYRELFEGAPLKYVLTENRDGVPWISDCNSTFLERLGYERSQVVGRPLSEFYGPTSAGEMLDQGYATALGERVEVERQLVTASGDLVDTLMVALPETGDEGEVTGTRAMYVDITARKQAEKKLARTGRRLRALSHRLESVREEERKALAREIHDELGQALTGIKLEIAWVDDKLAPEDPAIHERIESMTKIVDSSLLKVKDLSARLRPAALDDLGLGAAVEGQAQEFSSRYGISCVVDAPTGDRWLDGVAPETATALFRILQEAMTNVLRHAEATRIDISMKRSDADLTLRVEDDGKGIDLEAAASGPSLGILGMRERVEHIGGWLEIGPSKSGGTAVTARVPA